MKAPPQTADQTDGTADEADRTAGSPPPATVHPLERLARSGRATAVAGLWAFAEASLFFVVPDVWLGYVALFAPRRAARGLAAVVVGAMLGGALLYVAALAAPGTVRDLLDALPGVALADLGQAHAELAAQGLPAFLNGPLQGLPVKLYVHEAASLGLPLPGVLLLVALNRVERVGLSTLVMAILGVVGRRLVVRFPVPVAAVYGAAWLIFYAAYWLARSA